MPLFKRRDGHSVFSIRHKGHNIATHARHGTTKFIAKNPGIASAVAAVATACIPGATQLHVVLGGLAGSGVDAAAKHAVQKDQKKAADAKLLTEQQQATQRLNAAQAQAANAAAASQANLNSTAAQINDEKTQIHQQQDLIVRIKQCCSPTGDITQITPLVKKLDDEHLAGLPTIIMDLNLNVVEKLRAVLDCISQECERRRASQLNFQPNAAVPARDFKL